MLAETSRDILERYYAPMSLDKMSELAKTRKCLRVFEIWLSFYNHPKCLMDYNICIAFGKLWIQNIKMVESL
jgi:hypothetical protein